MTIHKKLPIKAALFGSISLSLLIALSTSVYAEPYGWSPQVDFSNQGPPKCTDSKPDKAPILLQPNHPSLPKPKGKGEVRLQWHKVPGATGYNVYYGLSPKNYIFTAPNIGDTNTFTVGHLANRVYYFAVQAKKGCAASSLSNEWAARPGNGGFVGSNVLAAATKVVPVKKKVTVQKPVEPVYLPEQTQPEVQGVTEEQNQPAYQPPVQQFTQPKAATVPPPAPKPKGFWQTILSIFGLAK